MFALCIESSHERGMGHLFRALNLATALRDRGHETLFLLNEHPPASAILAQCGFVSKQVDLLDNTSGWERAVIESHAPELWLNDRLDTTYAHAARVKAADLPLVTFDDRGDGASLADLHVAALAFDDQLLAGKCVLRGTNYLILNPEIARYQRLRSEPFPVLVSMGGSDTQGATVKVVEVLAELGIGATVVLGPGFVHHVELRAAMTDAFMIKSNVPSLMEEMAGHGLAITAGGITPFEANAAGLPCIVIACEDFEVPVARALQKLGGSVFAGHYEDIDATVFERQLPIAQMSAAGMSNIGLGGACRVVEALEALIPA